MTNPRFLFAIYILLLLATPSARAQNFYFGNDLSYVNQMEDCGAVYKEDMQPKDVYQIFADHGTNLVRVRLWLDPSWWQGPLVQPQGVKPWYNDLEDVRETIQRAKGAGMEVMLDLHFSDFWADPGRQLIPRAWLDVAYDLEAMKDSVYNYTTALLSGLDDEGLMPDIVKVGNENNPGILRHIPEEDGFEVIGSVSNSWNRHGQLYNKAIQAIREVGETASIDPKIAVHFSGGLSGLKWNFNNLLNNGVTDFDIMGFSYYYAWHEGSIAQLQSTVADLVDEFPDYEIMAVEMGYLWSTQNFDQLGNIITEPDPQYLPVSPATQLEYMIDYTRAVMKGGGTGVIFWEPAWVTTPCKTPWGTGTSHDHVAFFDPVNTNFMENGGGVWPEAPYYQDLSTHKVTFEVDMAGQDVSGGVYISGTFTDTPGDIRPMANMGGGIYSYFTYLPAGEEGGYFFLNGNDLAHRETVPAGCADWMDTDRKYSVPNHDIEYSNTWASCGETAVFEKDSGAGGLLFYPNPAGSSIALDCANCMGSGDVQLIDMSGNTIRGFYGVQSGERLDMSGLPRGMYFLKWVDEKRFFAKKVILE
ncbi:MAG: glycosyl hydrolase 53 family protein [Saprospirales bacterium]|nr:glycosyl hydrolase 53 family protein [Saprospirales bacterium]